MSTSTGITLGKREHWNVNNVCGSEVTKVWYVHKPEAVMVNDNYMEFFHRV